MLRRRLWMVMVLAVCGCSARATDENAVDPPAGTPPNVNPLDPFTPTRDTTDPTRDPTDPTADPKPLDPLDPPTRDPITPIVDPAVEVVIPNDVRSAVLAATPPPPISGGTLLVMRDGVHAVAADPDRD